MEKEEFAAEFYEIDIQRRFDSNIIVSNSMADITRINTIV